MVIVCVTHSPADGSRKLKYSSNEPELSDFLPQELDQLAP